MDWSFKKCWPNPEWWLSRVPLTRAVSVPLFLLQRLEELAKRRTGVCLCLCAPFACEEQPPHYQKDSRVSNDERSAKCFLYLKGVPLTVNLNETMNKPFLCALLRKNSSRAMKTETKMSAIMIDLI